MLRKILEPILGAAILLASAGTIAHFVLVSHEDRRPAWTMPGNNVRHLSTNRVGVVVDSARDLVRVQFPNAVEDHRPIDLVPLR